MKLGGDSEPVCDAMGRYVDGSGVMVEPAVLELLSQGTNADGSAANADITMSLPRGGRPILLWLRYRSTPAPVLHLTLLLL